MLHRKLKDNPVWTDPNYLKLWIYCLFEASHKAREQMVGNEIIKLKRGQFITGRSALAEEMNRGVKPKQRLSERTWFRYLKNLEEWGMLSIKSTNKYSIITIDNYDIYQSVSSKTVQESDQQMSNKCPTNDQQMSTNNNVNNDNNVNNYISTTTTEAKLEKQKQDAIIFYQNNFGIIRPAISENILAWIDDLGDEMVIEAMRRALARNKPSWAYVESILKSWVSKNIKTIEQAKAEETEFVNQRKNRFNKSQMKKKEVLPDWWHEHEKKKQQRQEENNNQSIANDQDVIELQEILNKYRK